MVTAPQTDETRTQAIAQELLGATQESRTFFGQMRDLGRWEDRLLSWAMDNPNLRTQLFRLIDCLPALPNKAEISRHLLEYLNQPQVELPGPLKSLLNFSQPDSLPGQLAATTLTTAVEALARKYIAGENPRQALKTLERLRRDRLSFTLDLLGEAVITEAEAQAYLERYQDLISQLQAATQAWPADSQLDPCVGGQQAKLQFSVKLTAFYSQFDPLDRAGSGAAVKARLRQLLRHAQTQGVMLHIDMEQYAYKNLTLAIVEELLLEPEFRDWAGVGLTLQAYLRDSEADCRRLLAWAQQRGTPVTLRLVKGAYWDQETIHAVQKGWPQPVYRDKASTDANFEHLTRLLLEDVDIVYPAIGSHNIRSQAHALAIAERRGLGPEHFECQVLYGMADRLAHALAQRGQRVRVYTPYGDLLPGMAYLIRRLLENTANSSFLRQSVRGVDTAQLLATPQVSPRETQPYPRPAGFANAPDGDFSDLTLPDQVQAAIGRVRQQLGKSYWPLIADQWHPTARTLTSVNPSNPEEVIGIVGLAGPAEVSQALDVAQAAGRTWAKTPVADRAACLERLADLMAAQRLDLVAWIVLEVGKPIREADAEVSEAIDFCRYYAQEMRGLGEGHAYDYPGETNRYRYQPRGLTVVITPWNYPLAIATGMVTAGLVAGNPVIFKPSEQSAVVGSQLAQLLVAAGLPPGVFQCLPGIGEEIGPLLVNHPAVHLIAFTGSRQVGCQIYAQAAQLQPGQTHLKRVIAEMGGKNAILVDASADLDQAVAGVVQSAFGYSGQKCSACSRVIVLESVYDKFLSRLLEAVRSLKVGPAEDSATRIGPVIDAAAQARLEQAVAQARTQTTLALEMPAPAGGYYVGPAVFTDVAPDHPLAQEELFGPVLAVFKVASFDQALTLANSTAYALTGGLYSRTPSHIERAAAEMACGNLYINRGITGALVGRHPFGGYRLSGVGSKAGGPDYLLQFLDPRHVSENIQRQGFAPLEEE